MKEADQEWSEPHPQRLEDRSASAQNARPVLVVIDSRLLIRECLTRCLSESSAFEVIGIGSPDEWPSHCAHLGVFVVLLSLSGYAASEQSKASIKRLSEVCPKTPIIVLSEGESLDDIVHVLKDGATGYIPTSLGLDVALDAVRLVKGGGVYLPPSSLSATHKGMERPNAASPMHPLRTLLTERQLKVLEGLRQGKANKIIAYELDMCESTVKVHIRNIMKKLKATNRTEVAYKANELLAKSNSSHFANGKTSVPADRWLSAGMDS